MNKQVVPISVLMSVYARERPEYLSEALQSLRNQSIIPAEVVLVKDGPLTPELDLAISESQLPNLKIIALQENRGLGVALRTGLDFCCHSLVARADSDDINDPRRLEEQFDFLNQNPAISVVGTWIDEFSTDPSQPDTVRETPVGVSRVLKFSRHRNPLNHMSVMFRKAAVVTVGSYRDFLWFEDYYLWVRLLTAGFRLDNIPKVMVHARVGNGMFSRRRGLKYFQREILLQLRFHRMKHTTSFHFFFNLVTRGAPRLIPERFMSRFYGVFLRK